MRNGKKLPYYMRLFLDVSADGGETDGKGREETGIFGGKKRLCILTNEQERKNEVFTPNVNFLKKSDSEW